MLNGSCLCGTAAYEADAALERIVHCHCRTCRKTHGAAFGEMGALRGYMVVVPTYTVSPASIAFAAQTRNTTSAAQTVTIANTGTVPLPFTNIALGGANAGSFAQTNTCAAAGLRPFPNSLAAGTSCTVSVTFRPTAVRSYSASLNISVGGAAKPCL